MSASRNVVCIACARVFADRGKLILVCPDCGTRVGRERYERLHAHARTVVQFGYAYRRHFEDKHESNAHPYIGVSDALVFVAIAALSGVIGNATYDVIKSFARKVLAQLGQGDDTVSVETVIEYVQEFHTHGVVNRPRDVGDGIRHEFITEYQSQFFMRVKERRRKFDGATLRKGLQEATEAWDSKPCPPIKDFVGVGSAASPKRRRRRRKR